MSQSVEQDHPAAFDFLRSDIKNADDFFNRRGIDTLGLTRTFNYVTRPAPHGGPETDDEMAAEAARLVSLLEQDALEPEDNEDEDNSNLNDLDQSGRQVTTDSATAANSKPSASDEAVFAQSYIPRALDQVYDIERDVARVLKGEGDDLIYADITGVADIRKRDAKSTGARFNLDPTDPSDVRDVQPSAGDKVAEPSQAEDGSGDESDDGSASDSDDESGSESDVDEDGNRVRRPKGKKFEDKDEKKVRLVPRQLHEPACMLIEFSICPTQKRRQETKEKAREKRTQKMKKSEKARRMKKSSGKKK